ncbi:MAG: hypothetical protein Q4F00_07855 [bacterium]|nr:hypothetical protein [bacterium]
MEFRDYTEIVFQDGDILSARMLEETYRYPREFLHLAHAGYGEGIIAGLDFETREGSVYLTAGLVKMGGSYFILPQAVNLEAWFRLQMDKLQSAKGAAGSTWYCLCLVQEDIAEPGEQSGGFTHRSRISLKAEREKPPQALLLARYKYSAGIKLQLPGLLKVGRGDNPFAQFTQAAYLQLLDCAYAHPQGETTYHPLVFRALRSYLEQKQPLSPYDFSLLLEIQNCGIVALSALRAYVAAVSGTAPASVSALGREKLLAEVIACLQKPFVPYRVAEAENHSERAEKTDSKPHCMLLD